MDLPINKDELLSIAKKVEDFADDSIKEGSLERVFIWLELVYSINKIITKEEELANKAKQPLVSDFDSSQHE